MSEFLLEGWNLESIFTHA